MTHARSRDKAYSSASRWRGSARRRRGGRPPRPGWPRAASARCSPAMAPARTIKQARADGGRQGSAVERLNGWATGVGVQCRGTDQPWDAAGPSRAWVSHAWAASASGGALRHALWGTRVSRLPGRRPRSNRAGGSCMGESCMGWQRITRLVAMAASMEPGRCSMRAQRAVGPTYLVAGDAPPRRGQVRHQVERLALLDPLLPLYPPQAQHPQARAGTAVPSKVTTWAAEGHPKRDTRGVNLDGCSRTRRAELGSMLPGMDSYCIT